jgi:DHA2 family multidrug resistance protein
MPRYDARILASIPMLLLAASYFWRGHFASNITFDMVMAANVVLGVSMPMFALPTIALSLSALKPQDIASANGAIAFARTISIAFATSLITTYWRDSATVNRDAIVDRLNAANSLGKISATGMPADQSLSTMDLMVQNQAVMMATNDTYLLMAAVAALLALTVWIAPKEKPGRR